MRLFCFNHLRVVRGVLQTWLERHPQDFRDSPQCLQIISSYLSQDSRENPSQLLRLVKSLEEEGEQDCSPKGKTNLLIQNSYVS